MAKQTIEASIRTAAQAPMRGALAFQQQTLSKRRATNHSVLLVWDRKRAPAGYVTGGLAQTGFATPLLNVV